jgi:hypothetical protein
MHEAKDPKRASNETTEGSRDSDATSSETLSDIEDKEKVSDANDDNEPSSTPSPDGAFDEGRGGSDDAGPM